LTSEMFCTKWRRS